MLEKVLGFKVRVDSLPPHEYILRIFASPNANSWYYNRPLTPVRDIVLDHYENPRNIGEMSDADGVGVVENAACGDVMQLYLNIETDTIVEASFKAYGCAPAIAAGSVLTELLTGAPLEDAKQLKKEDVASALGGLPPMKQHCSVLAADALDAALADYHSRSEETSNTST